MLVRYWRGGISERRPDEVLLGQGLGVPDFCLGFGVERENYLGFRKDRPEIGSGLLVEIIHAVRRVFVGSWHGQNHGGA